LKTIWFDFTNPPHVNFFLPIIRHYEKKGVEIKLTAREFVETTKLLKLNNLTHIVYGKHGGRGKLSKIYELISRELQLLSNLSDFDYSLSTNYEAPLASWLKRKPSFVFDDNDISPNWLYAKFAKYVISPNNIDKDAMFRMGIKNKQLVTYNGFKENIYIADYRPNPIFLAQLPFTDFITVRPENIQASYVPSGRRSIVPQLIESLIAKGYNVLYLPRYKSDRDYVSKNDKLFIPTSPLNGLDVCYYSNAVLTGAGTFSREAAVMGTPAVSFFAGDEFLGVDKIMFSKKMVFFSRNVNDIVNFVEKSKKKEFNRQQSVDVQNELFSILDTLIK
jgi:uncharacterized protein